LSATEPQRLALHAAARAALGPEEGDTLMALTPPANTDIATMQALQMTKSELLTEIERVNSRTLRWTVGTVVASNAGVVALLAAILG
jgi:hypothetical protein